MTTSAALSNLTVRVLMLEDNPADAALITRHLATHGLLLDRGSDHVQNSKEFVNCLATRRYDLILCDFTIPGWNGLEALRWVRKSGHDTPFIYVSGTLGEEVAVECIREGATDYILKSNMSRLSHAVRRALDERELRRAKQRIEDEKRELDTQYRLLFDGNPQSMWVVDRNTLAFLAVNDAALSHYGYSRDEFLRMTLLDILPTQNLRDRLRSMLNARTGDLQITEIMKHVRKDKTVIDVEVSRNRVKFGGIDAILVLSRDITEFKRNEDRLHHSEERFSKAFRSSPIAITISTKAEGRYIEANDAFLRILNRPRENVIGHTAFELNVWDSPEDRRAMVNELERTGRVAVFETRFNSISQGTRTVRISAETIELGETSCILSIITDITSAKTMEEQFRQAQKMEAVGRLAGGIAHDFNNMLSVIIGYCDLSHDHSDLELVRRDTRQIKTAAQRAAKLTSQLLAFSRQQVVRPCVLNLNTVVNDVLQMLLRVIAADVRLAFQAAKTLGNIKADLGQIEQILMNLVVNARDAMPEGGSIIIETANVTLDEAYARVHPRIRSGLYVMLSVSDTGSGIEPENLSKIFDPFFTTKAPGTGTGLGLSMVYGAMEQSGGHIVVYSEVGRGTTFKLYFPRIDGDVEQPFLPRVDVAMERASETVLLVEDETELRKVTQELLESEGYKVLAAEDGQKALECVDSYVGPIHAMLTDVVLPGMSGREVAERVSTMRPHIKTVYMSGYTGALIAKQGVLDPGVALLTKPFSKSDLLAQMRSVLKQ